MELLSVDNLVFVLPLALAIILVLLMALGLPVGDDGLHFDTDISHIAHIGGAADGVHVPDMHGHIHAPGVLHAVVGFFGVGKVPFMLVLVSFCMIWGGTGLALHLLKVEWSLLSRCLLAGVVAIAGTRLVASTMSRLLPSVETYGVPAEDLLSEYAEVIHDVTADGGTVRLVDSAGNLRDLPCRITPARANTAPTQHFKRGERVMLSSYDAANDIFFAVEPNAVPQPISPAEQTDH